MFKKLTIAVLVSLITFYTSAEKNPETSPSVTFPQFNKQVTELWQAGKKEDAAALLESGIDRYPDRNYAIMNSLVFIYLRMDKPDKCMNMFELGHKKGHYFPIYTESGPFSSLTETARFQNIYMKNRELIRHAEKNTKADFRIIKPDSYNPGKKYPLLIILHGWNGTSQQIQKVFKTESSSEKIITVYIQSSQIAGENTYCWTDYAKSLNDILSVIPKVTGTCSVDSNRIILSGFSQGGAVAMSLALNSDITCCGFIAHCPGGSHLETITDTGISAASEKNIKGILISTEMDTSRKQQQEIMKRFNNYNLECVFLDINGAGHWIPNDFPEYLDKAVNVLLEDRTYSE